jgi:hypothetical protein
MKQISAQSKSFIVLSTIAIVGTLCAVVYSQVTTVKRLEEKENIKAHKQGYETEENSNPAKKSAEAVDVSKWKQYTDDQHSFSFMYKPDWKVKAPVTTKDGYYLVEIDPGPRFDNIKIYVSDNNYYVMEGLPLEPKVLGTSTKKPALSVSDLLYGMEDGGLYYTFDLGASLSLQPYFKAMVDSVKF